LPADPLHMPSGKHAEGCFFKCVDILTIHQCSFQWLMCAYHVLKLEFNHRINVFVKVQ